MRQPRGKSLESLEDIHDNSTRSHLTFSHYTATDYGHFAHPTPAMQQQHHQQALQHQQQQHQQAMQQHHQAAMMGGAVVGGPGGTGGARLLNSQAAMVSILVFWTSGSRILCSEMYQRIPLKLLELLELYRL